MRLVKALVSLMVISGLSACGPAENAVSFDIAAQSASETELYSNRYTHAESAEEAVSLHSLTGCELLIENKLLAVYYDAGVGALKVADKRSGYIWGSLASGGTDKLTDSWARLAGSVVAIDAFNEKAALSSVGAERVAVSEHAGKVRIAAEFPEQEISLQFELSLDQDKLIFDLSDADISEKGEHKLAAVYFLPFFGATEGAQLPGYFLVPDGCGALMRFSESTQYLSGFVKRVYGEDIGISAVTPLENLKTNRTESYEAGEQSVNFPIYGVCHGAGQNAFLCAAENGGEYAEINAVPAGVITEYNRAFIKFIYRQKYEQPISRKGAGVQAPQKDRNLVDPRLVMTFLTGGDADYVGMARAYKETLGLKNRSKSGAVPLSIDFICADIKRELLGSTTLLLTEYDELSAYAREFSALAPALQLTLLGWQKGGLNGYNKSASALSTVYGGLDELSALNTLLSGNLRLSLVALTAKKGQYNARADGAVSMSQADIKSVSNDDALFLGDTYYLKPQNAAAGLSAQIAALAARGFSKIAVFDLGNMLYSDYSNGGALTRAETKRLLIDAVPDGSALENPNDYLFSKTAYSLQTPVGNSQFLYETDAVPFMQIVLSGSADMLARYSNLGFYSKADILKHIDYNMYPAFLLTGDGELDLSDTALSMLQRSKAADWKHYIADSYAQINAVLANIRGQSILGRTVIDEGFVKITYETGGVLVNYTHSEKRCGDIAVPAESAVYVGGLA
jgi:hypothetical protein